jgi:hypothetical protein
VIGSEPVAVVGGGLVEARVCSGRLRVPALQFDEVVRLFAIPGGHGSSQVLLGREFLKHFVFTFDGPEEMFSWYYPPSYWRDQQDDFAT